MSNHDLLFVIAVSTAFLAIVEFLRILIKALRNG